MSVCRKESAAKRLYRSQRFCESGLSSLRTVIVTCACSLLLVGCESTAGEKTSGLFSAATAPAVNVARNLWNGSGSDASHGSLVQGSKFSKEGLRAAEQAKQLFDDENYATAAKSYKKIAEKYQGSSVGEDAQFQLAESWYALNRFPKAQDGYDQLFVDYPSTRYVQPATKRLYQIAQNWLDLADPAHRSKIRTVSAVEVEFEDPESVPPPPTTLSLRNRILPNFSDKTRPIFDTQGRALKALKGIWLNDPTGPLADDALMATASYYLRREDYVESDRYFKILRDEYPDSPHLKDAFLLGAHVRLMSYQGPAYDGTSLAGADQLTAQSLNLYPDSRERPQLRQDLQKIHLLKAQRIWDRVLYYEKKNSDRAVGLTCVRLINEFPNTKFADMARDRLATLDHDELKVLPGFDRMLKSLSEERPRNEAPRPKVKAVSATAEDLDRRGFE
jgi:outer membrane protein assembly factor BamD (BamD/ComL family)